MRQVREDAPYSLIRGAGPPHKSGWDKLGILSHGEGE